MRVIALLLMSAAVARTQTPDIQAVLDRLDKLEDENRRLHEEIETLRAELTVKGAPISERVDVQETQTAELEQTKVGASQRLPITLTGMLLFNAYSNGHNAGTSQYPTLASLNTAPAPEGASLRQTVIGLKFQGPQLPFGGKAGGSLYMDFFGGTNTPGNSLIQLRIATLDLEWKNTTITVGQDKPIISPREPVSLAQVGVSPLTTAGNLWDWNPQARIEQRFAFGSGNGLRAQAGMYEAEESTTNVPAQFAASVERLRPSYEARFEFFHTGKWKLEFAPGMHFGATRAAGMSVDSRIGSFDWLFQPIPALEFTGQVFRGQDVGGLGALQGFNVSADGILNAVHTHGEWGQIALFPASRLSFRIYSGEQYNRPLDIQAGAIMRNFLVAGNVIYKLAPNVLAAFEASQTRTQYIVNGLRLNAHYDLALAYLF
jgi:hypothetical protein